MPHCLFRGRKEYFRDWKRNFEKKFANRIDEVFVEECYFWKKNTGRHFDGEAEERPSRRRRERGLRHATARERMRRDARQTCKRSPRSEHGTWGETWWTKRSKRAARTGGSRGRSRDLGIPNPHLIRESRFPPNNPLFSNRFDK